MKYKYKVGDKVRVKAGSDLISIGVVCHIRSLDGVLTITERHKGRWSCNPEFTGNPTYMVGRYLLPEVYLEKG